MKPIDLAPARDPRQNCLGSVPKNTSAEFKLAASAAEFERKNGRFFLMSAR
jgi:hypothetical protein